MGSTGKEPAERVVVEDPEHTNLLGLLMKNLAASNLANESTYERVRGMEGDIQIRAGDMVVTMRFGGGQLRIIEGEQEKPRARVQGSMPALLSVVTGGGMIGPLLSGAIKIGGNPFTLLKVLPIIQAPEGDGT
ncbi:MAG: hypothetical protein JRG91_09065 [Deltaproteobacteria bacterium]|nr:hypothetical protein [Deltaproteobacteria bacterium]